MRLEAGAHFCPTAVNNGQVADILICAANSHKLFNAVSRQTERVTPIHASHLNAKMGHKKIRNVNTQKHKIRHSALRFFVGCAVTLTASAFAGG